MLCELPEEKWFQDSYLQNLTKLRQRLLLVLENLSSSNPQI